MPSAGLNIPSNGFMAVGIADRQHVSPMVAAFLPSISREAQLQVLQNESRGSSRRSSAVMTPAAMTPDNASIASADSKKEKTKKSKKSKIAAFFEPKTSKGFTTARASLVL